MSTIIVPPKGSEVRRKADGLVCEICDIDPPNGLLTIRWKAGGKYQTLICTSDQFYPYWDVLRMGPRKGSVKVLLLVVAAIVLLVWAANSGSGNSASSNSQNASSGATDQPKPQVQPEKVTPPPITAEQLSDAQYLDDKYGISGVSHCDVEADDYLRSIAKYDYKWDETGFLETKFDQILTHTKGPGVLTLVSKKAKLQNGFGAFQHITLYCDYDTQAEKIVRFDFASE